MIVPPLSYTRSAVAGLLSNRIGPKLEVQPYFLRHPAPHFYEFHHAGGDDMPMWSCCNRHFATKFVQIAGNPYRLAFRKRRSRSSEHSSSTVDAWRAACVFPSSAAYGSSAWSWSGAVGEVLTVSSSSSPATCSNRAMVTSPRGPRYRFINLQGLTCAFQNSVAHRSLICS